MHSNKIFEEIITYARKLQPTKIKIKKFPKSLPKLRPNLNKPNIIIKDSDGSPIKEREQTPGVGNVRDLIQFY